MSERPSARAAALLAVLTVVFAIALPRGVVPPGDPRAPEPRGEVQAAEAARRLALFERGSLDLAELEELLGNDTESERAPAAQQETFDVELDDMRREPGPWLGRRVRFFVHYAGLRESWQPYLTSFGPADFVAFRAWSDGARLWEKAPYQNPSPYLFARRNGEAAAVLALARPHERYLVTGRVADVFLGEPWIAVETLERQAQQLPEGTLLHLDKAREFVTLEQWDLAFEQFERALAAPLPDPTRAAIEALRADVELVRLANTQPTRR